MHNSFVFSIVLEQFLAKTEKRRMRHAIVFKNNGLFHLFEHPAQSGGRTVPASEVDLRVVFQDLTWPIDALDDSAGRSAFCTLTFTVWPGTIGNNEELFRTGTGYLSKNPLR